MKKTLAEIRKEYWQDLKAGKTRVLRIHGKDIYLIAPGYYLPKQSLLNVFKVFPPETPCHIDKEKNVLILQILKEKYSLKLVTSEHLAAARTSEEADSYVGMIVRSPRVILGPRARRF